MSVTYVSEHTSIVQWSLIYGAVKNIRIHGGDTVARTEGFGIQNRKTISSRWKRARRQLHIAQIHDPIDVSVAANSEWDFLSWFILCVFPCH